MSNKFLKYNLLDKSETFGNLPKPEFNEIMVALGSFGHQYIQKNGFHIERDDYDMYMLTHVAQGKLKITYNDKNSEEYQSFTLNSGQTCFLYLGNPSTISALNENVEIYFFHVYLGNTKKIYRQVVELGGNVIKELNQKIVIDCFNNLKNVFKQSPPDLYISSSIVTSLLLETLKASNKKEEKSPKIVQLVTSKLIFKHYSVEELAKELGFHPVYLERQFKKSTGKSLREYIVQRKLDMAENLLLTTNKSILEIALELGYNDVNGLISIFKKQLKTTPLAFRKAHSKK